MVERYFARFTKFWQPPRSCQNLLAESLDCCRSQKILTLAWRLSGTNKKDVLTDIFYKKIILRHMRPVPYTDKTMCCIRLMADFLCVFNTVQYNTI